MKAVKPPFGDHAKIFETRKSLALLQVMAGNKDHDGQTNKAEDDNLDVVSVAGKAFVELLLRHDGLHIPAQNGQHGVPKTGTDGRVEQEFPIAHACHTGRNRDEMAYDWHETTSERGHDAVAIEVAFAFLYLFLIEQTKVSPTAVGKAIDDGAAQIASCKVVDGSPAVGTDGSCQNDKPHVEMAAGSKVGGRRHHKLRGNGDDRTLKKHQKPYPIVVEVFENELVEFHYCLYLFVD